MEYYRVREGRTLFDQDDKVLGEGGDVIKLATDSKDKTIRHEAEGILMGQWSRVTKVGKPEKKKAAPKGKKASYSTKEATPEA